MFEDEDWENPVRSFGRTLFPQPDGAEVCSVVEFSKNVLTGVPEATRQKLLTDLDRLFSEFSLAIGRNRQCVRSGSCVGYMWYSVGGRPANIEFDADIFGRQEFHAYPAFVCLLREISRDAERAFLKAISLIVLRDYGNGDNNSVVKARKHFDIWSARLISRDESTDVKRRRGGHRRGLDIRTRNEHVSSDVKRLANKFRRNNVPTSEWVKKIDAGLDRGPDAPYPSSRTIRRILEKSGLLP